MQKKSVVVGLFSDFFNSRREKFPDFILKQTWKKSSNILQNFNKNKIKMKQRYDGNIIRQILSWLHIPFYRTFWSFQDEKQTKPG